MGLIQEKKIKGLFENMKDCLPANLETVRKTVAHGGMYIGLVIYTAIGAKVFQVIENPVEVDTLETYQAFLISGREKFLQSVWNESLNNANYRENIDQLLSDYEVVVEEAVSNGINVVTQDFTINWNYVQSVFFSTTILTTIGYGNIAPVTTAGRSFCIVFAIIGIPYTLTVMADIGALIATMMTAVWTRYKEKVRPLLQEKKIIQSIIDEEEAGEEIGFVGNMKTAGGAILFLVVFLSFGAFFFSAYEDLSFFDAFYFTFITMFTIGFGDIVPDIVGDKGAYMLLCTIYILVGMTCTTTILEIVRRQYAESWKKMQELRAHIQAQLKLADHLRKLGENGELDPESAAELEKIQQNLSKIKNNKGLDDIGIDWVENNKKLKTVTIIFYETSL